VLRAIGTVVAGGTAGCSQGQTGSRRAFRVSSPALEPGGTLPVRFTCDGEGISPPLRIDRIPDPVEAVAVTAKSVGGPFDNPLFWTLWNAPAETGPIPAGLPREETVASLEGARQGTGNSPEAGYEPPCPPEGQNTEHWIQIHALGERLALESGAIHDTAEEAIRRETVASNRITVSYTRPRS